ncbi:MAG: rhodanese-like domain-containing protein [Candidatus Odinarchaeota archaeon]
MRITTIRSEGISALSYFVSSEQQGIVIDPRRDASIYNELALREDVEILYIFETHRNEDYVIGSLELQSMVPNAEIGHSDATNFHYGELSLADGETFKVGKMHITCLNTPGHTNDSMCYIISDREDASEPIVVFTGDTLFVNEVGRTDLVDMSKHALMSQKLYDSLHGKILQLGDGVIIHPGHGAGSVCGGAIGDREFSTIGFERFNNVWLKMSEDDFIESKIKQELTLAPYFKHCELLNTKGPPVLSAGVAPQELDLASFETLLSNPNHVVLDTRSPTEFLNRQIPRTISMSLTNMGLFAGWILKPNQSISLILGNRENLGEAWSYLVRLGFDNVVGFLENGITSWIESGRATTSIKTISIDDLKIQLDNRTLLVVDVRESHEYKQEHIKDSISLPLTRLVDTAPSLKFDRTIATLCSSGFRSTTAASILSRNDITNILAPSEGFKSWMARGLPTEE